jgi:hypothetical protein
MDLQMIDAREIARRLYAAAIQSNSGYTLVATDTGITLSDGILCVQFHDKGYLIGINMTTLSDVGVSLWKKLGGSVQEELFIFKK